MSFPISSDVLRELPLLLDLANGLDKESSDLTEAKVAKFLGSLAYKKTDLAGQFIERCFVMIDKYVKAGSINPQPTEGSPDRKLWQDCNKISLKLLTQPKFSNRFKTYFPYADLVVVKVHLEMVLDRYESEAEFAVLSVKENFDNLADASSIITKRDLTYWQTFLASNPQSPLAHYAKIYIACIHLRLASQADALRSFENLKNQIPQWKSLWDQASRFISSTQFFDETQRLKILALLTSRLTAKIAL